MAIKWVIFGIAFAALVAGAWIFFNPSPPEEPRRISAETEPVDERTGLYSSRSDGSLWLVAPAIDGGWVRYRVDRVAPIEKLDGEPADHRNLRRAEDQPYGLRAIALDDPVLLEGWVFEPRAPDGPGIVMVHGSGASDRTNGYYLALAHQLARAGHTVVLPDKRGSGRSTGDWRNTPLAVMARDAAAWLEWLRGETALSHYGFVGVSQGGSISPQAALLADADFAVAIGSSATDYNTQLRHEVGNDVREAGVPDILHQPLTSIYTYRAKRRQPGFWAANGEYDTLNHWREWGGPFLIGYGAEDEGDNVPVGQSVRQLEALPAGRRPEWRVYDGVGHGLTDDNGRFAPAFLSDLRRWLGRFAQTPDGESDGSGERTRTE